MSLELKKPSITVWWADGLGEHIAAVDSADGRRVLFRPDSGLTVDQLFQAAELALAE